MTSILTNIAAMSALQTLRSIGQGMEETQARVSSGLRVGTASDNAAYWSIATTMRSDNMALSAVSDALGMGAAKVDTAYAGMESSIDVMKQIKQKLVAATEEGVDKSKVQEEISQLQDQLKSIASSASFYGENWLQADLSGSKESLAKSVVGSFVRTGDAVSVKRIDHALDSSTVLFDTNSATGAAKGGILDATLKLEEKRTGVEITTAKPVTVTGENLVKGGSTFAAATGTAAEKYTTDGGDVYVRYNDANGQVRDANGKDLWVKVVASATAPAAPNSTTAKAANGTTDLSDGTNPYYVVTQPVVETKNVAATTEAALKDASSKYVITAPLTYTAATGTFGGTISADDKAAITAEGFMKVEISASGVATVYSGYNAAGAPDATKTETYIKLGADDTWVKATDNGTGAANEYKNGVKGVLVGTNYYSVDASNTTIASSFGKVDTDAGVSVSDLDITKLADLGKKLGYTEKEVLGKLIQYVDDQLKTATSATADLGSIKMRIGLQEDFVSKLTDSIESGIGRLVDAEMNEESTRLKALQTQQQLAVQSLSIANNDSQNILSLFR